MRKKLFYALSILASFAVIASSCGKDDDGKKSGGEENEDAIYTLIASPLSLDFGWNNPAPQTVTVTTNSPYGVVVGKTASWYTAAVDGNKLTVTVQSNDGEARNHILELTAPKANKVTITVNQAAKGEIPASLSGSKYIVFTLDPTSAESISDKIVYNMAEHTNIDIWATGDTFAGVEATGPGFYGINNSGYMALTTTGKGWSGGGFGLQAGTAEAVGALWKEIVNDGGEDWYFHVAVRGTKGAGNAFRFCDANPDNEPTNLWVRCDNYDLSETDWLEIELPLKSLVSAGWVGATTGYVLTFHGGGGSNQNFFWDALFIYKK